eukprot:g26377.t1
MSIAGWVQYLLPVPNCPLRRRNEITLPPSRRETARLKKGASPMSCPLAHLIKVPLYSEMIFFIEHYTIYFGVICKLTNHTSYIHIQTIYI